MASKKKDASKVTPDKKAMDPTPKKKDTLPRVPVVGIGASAGGLKALETFFSAMPPDSEPGMAFVLVQHLDPDHKSILTQLIQRFTRMQVFEVEDGMKVEPNCAYIIPPNRDMALMDGTLQLMEPSAPRGHRLPIDFFFCSLARDLQEKAIGVILSGTGSDGSLGLREIKDEGGMVMAQSPDSTEFDGMPRSAIDTGLVDYVLPPSDMPDQLIAYASFAFGRQLQSLSTSFETDDLKKIFILLRGRTGHDFSKYKQNTILRRVDRRMAIQHIERPNDYVKFLQHTPEEVDALFLDFLIGVTQFFRDPEAFDILEKQVIPTIFNGKPAGSFLRVWVPGCSTGEEAYSIAILLQERLDALKQNVKVQVFATDIDSRSIDKARSGVYTDCIAKNVSPERLARFFVHDPKTATYRIHKNIRDMLIFSEQNVIKDPPFSKLDLISCRNLLIYLNGELQKKLIPLFHYALNPEGVLFLGTSETVGEFLDLFSIIDRKSKVYRRKGDLYGVHRPAMERFLPPLSHNGCVPHATWNVPVEIKPPLKDLTEQTLLQQYDSVGILINLHGDILYLHGRSGLYLEPSPGEAGVNNILKMAREGLDQALTMTLNKAVSHRKKICKPGIRVKTNGDYTCVNLTVLPVPQEHVPTTYPALFLVILENTGETVDPHPATAPISYIPDLLADENPTDTDLRIVALKRELKAKEDYLQSTNEELETSNEELKSANEEMQSVNEELQSTNEELETSKEELQSVNEELSTVNAELQQKVMDLSRANNDMNNLLAGTGIGTIFIDHHMRILRFTPAVSQVINLIPTDVGRPVGHIVSNLVDYDRLIDDVQAVLDTLEARETEVRTRTGEWFSLRVRPYRTLENVIEGAVITFIDITEMKRIREAVFESETKHRFLFDTMKQGVVYQDNTGRIIDANPAAERILGCSLVQMRELDPASPPLNAIQKDGSAFDPKAHPAMIALKTGKKVHDVIMGIPFPQDKRTTWISINAIPQFKPGQDIPYQVYSTLDDITGHIAKDP